MPNIISLVRLWIARFPSTYYWVTPALLLLTTICAFTIAYEVDQDIHSIREEYFHLRRTPVIAVVSIAVIFGLSYLSIHFWKNQFLPNAVAEQTFSLPVSNNERYGALLLVNFVVLPLIAFVPVILLTMAALHLTPEFVVAPNALTLFPGVFIGLVPHLVFSAVVFLPSILFPKRAVIFLLVLGVVMGVGFGLVAESLSPTSNFVLLDPTVYAKGDVVGLSEMGFTNLSEEPKEGHLSAGDPTDLLQMIGVTLMTVLFVAAGYLGLLHKQA